MNVKRRGIFGLIGIFLLASLQPAQAEIEPGVPGIHLVSTSSQAFTLDLAAPAYSLVDDALSLTGALTTAQEGQPALPYFAAWLAVPPTGAVELRILSQDVSLARNTSLKPFTPLARTLPVGESESTSLTPTSPVETSRDLPAVRLGQPAWLRDQRLVRLEYYPFQFDSASNTLTWRKHLRVEVRFGAGAALPVSTSSKSPAYEDVFRTILLNYDQGLAWRTASTGALRSTAAVTPENFPTSGTRLKIAVNQDGLYRLTYTDLSAAFNMTTLDPHNLRLFNQGREVAVWIDGESDSVFDPADTITFYGEKFRGDYLASLYTSESAQYVTYANGWQPQFNATMLEKYTDDNVYWLVQDSGTGSRMSELSATPTGAELATSYLATIHAEESLNWRTWHFTGEDTWFWNRIENQAIVPHTFSLSSIAPGDFLAVVRGELVANFHNENISPDHHTHMTINSIELDNTMWDGINRYHFEKQVSQSALLEGVNSINVNVIWDSYLGQSFDRIYTDWFEVEYNRLFTTSENALAFSGDQTGARRYQVTGITSSGYGLVDITNPLQPVWLTGATLTSGVLEFQRDSANLPKFYAAGSEAFKTAKSISAYTPPDLFSASNGADYLIIAPSEFTTAAARLAAYRAGQGLRSKVVDFTDLVNLFNFGIYHPIAIKNFLAYTFSNWAAPAPTYTLLVGDGHWNFKSFRPTVYCGNQTCPKIFMPPNLAWVDYTQGEVDSSNMLATIIGDDIYPDLLIGRVPVNSETELDAVIDKTIAYEASPLRQPWQNQLLFIADDADLAGDFEALSDALVQDFVRAPFEATKIYRRDFSCSNPCNEVAKTITDFLNQTGAFLLSYVGHGYADGWANERIIRTENIESLANGSHLPVILSMTCTDGYWISPGASNIPTSFIEELVRAPNKGAVATFSSTGWGESAGHDIMEHAIFDQVFNWHVRQLSQATLAGRMAVALTGSDRDIVQTYTIFGDPALRLRSALNIYMPLLSK